jgi:hypothetical protein
LILDSDIAWRTLASNGLGSTAAACRVIARPAH